MSNSQTLDEIVADIRQPLAEDMQKHLSGMCLCHNEAIQLCFDHRMTTVVGLHL